MRIKNTLLIFLLFAFTIALLLRPLINFQGSFSPAAELKSGVLDVSSLDLDQVIYQLTGDIEIYQIPSFPCAVLMLRTLSMVPCHSHGKLAPVLHMPLIV